MFCQRSLLLLGLIARSAALWLPKQLLQTRADVKINTDQHIEDAHDYTAAQHEDGQSHNKLKTHDWLEDPDGQLRDYPKRNSKVPRDPVDRSGSFHNRHTWRLTHNHEVLYNTTAARTAKATLGDLKVKDNVPSGSASIGMPQVGTVPHATVSEIISVQVIVLAPVAVMWIMYVYFGRQQTHYLVLLPLLYCALQIGEDLVNQSLLALVNAPNVVATSKTLIMSIACGTWALCFERKEMQDVNFSLLRMWLLVSISFAGFQMLNHVVYEDCSLAERTVFTNLSPAAALFFELAVMPENRKPSADPQVKMALLSMVIGAILFSLQYPDFSTKGVISCMLMVTAQVPLRIMQRWFISEYFCMPIALLSCMDGIVLLIPTMSISVTVQDDIAALLRTWFGTSSIPSMFVLSALLFTTKHVLTLIMLRVASVTRFLVFHSIANFLIVALGFVYFGDQLLGAPLVILGLVVSLLGGVWYAMASLPKAGPAAASIDKGDNRLPGAFQKFSKAVSDVEEAPERSQNDKS